MTVSEFIEGWRKVVEREHADASEEDFYLVGIGMEGMDINSYMGMDYEFKEPD